MAKATRKINHLGKFKTSGIKVSELIEAKEAEATLFESIYEWDGEGQLKFDALFFSAIPSEANSWLDKVLWKLHCQLV